MAGRRSALLVGIDWRRDLRQCPWNDLNIVGDTLVDSCDFAMEDIFFIVDDDDEHLPTAASILQEMHLMTQHVGPADVLLFYFAGHGLAYDGGLSINDSDSISSKYLLCMF